MNTVEYIQLDIRFREVFSSLVDDMHKKYGDNRELFLSDDIRLSHRLVYWHSLFARMGADEVFRKATLDELVSIAACYSKIPFSSICKLSEEQLAGSSFFDEFEMPVGELRSLMHDDRNWLNELGRTLKFIVDCYGN